MKATINKSTVMQRAWLIYKSGNSFYSFLFGASLSRAWEVEKTNLANKAREDENEKRKQWYKSNESFIRNSVYASTGNPYSPLSNGDQ